MYFEQSDGGFCGTPKIETSGFEEDEDVEINSVEAAPSYFESLVELSKEHGLTWQEFEARYTLEQIRLLDFFHRKELHRKSRLLF